MIIVFLNPKNCYLLALNRFSYYMRYIPIIIVEVIEYCVHHKDDPIVDEEEEKRRKYERERNRKCGEIMLMIDGVELVEEDMNPEEKRTDNLSEWDQQFVNVSKG